MKWMDRERSFWVIEGDLRQRALARLLREDGHTVHIAGLEGEGLEPEPLGPGLALAHCVILPLPVAVGESFVHTPLSAARLPLAQVLDCLRPGQLVCGGMISPAVTAEMTRRGLRWADYYAREECMVANAVPTAEGAVQVAMEELPITLHSARVLILGFGRESSPPTGWGPWGRRSRSRPSPMRTWPGRRPTAMRQTGWKTWPGSWGALTSS